MFLIYIFRSAMLYASLLIFSLFSPLIYLLSLSRSSLFSSSSSSPLSSSSSLIESLFSEAFSPSSKACCSVIFFSIFIYDWESQKLLYVLNFYIWLINSSFLSSSNFLCSSLSFWRCSLFSLFSVYYFISAYKYCVNPSSFYLS